MSSSAIRIILCGEPEGTQQKEAFQGRRSFVQGIVVLKKHVQTWLGCHTPHATKAGVDHQGGKLKMTLFNVS
jgi:hypothetical protein